MEELNKVELVGSIGYVRQRVADDRHIANFQLATNHIHRGKDGTTIIETTWHTLIASEGKNISREDIDKIKRGAKAHVFGRIRNVKLVDPINETKILYEVLVKSIEFVENDGAEVDKN